MTTFDKTRGRRRMATALLALGALLASGAIWRAGAAGSGSRAPARGPSGAAPRSVAYPTRTMGTYANVVIVTRDSAAADPAARHAHAVFRQVDSLMSNWTTTSEVARINRVAADAPTTVEPQVSHVIEASLDLWRASGGVFDITVEPLVRLWGFLGGPKRVPTEDEVKTCSELVGAQRVHFDPEARTIAFEKPGMKIDLGGIAKGYAVDEAAKSLAADGIQSALVDLTGNMRTIGSPPDADQWRIGIRDPRDRLPWFARLRLDPGQAISTSGKYEQFVAKDGRTYGHIIDPRTGWPAEGLISVTIVARTALDCDAWDTPLFVLGPTEARRKAKEREDVAAVLVEPGADGIDIVWVEKSLRDRFVLESQARTMFRVEYF